MYVDWTNFSTMTQSRPDGPHRRNFLRLCEKTKASADAVNDRRGNCFRKIGGQAIQGGLYGPIGVAFDLVEYPSKLIHGYTARRRGLQEMTWSNRLHHVMPVITNGHRELHPVVPDLSRVHIGLSRHDIVERRHMEPAARQQKDAEILRMAVGRAQQPKDNLRFQEKSPVGFMLIASLQELDNVANTGTTVGFVFARGRHGQSLAAI